MAETQAETKTLSLKDRLKEEILAKHRLMRVLPRTQMELREQENNLAETSIKMLIENVYSEIEHIGLSSEQKAKILEIRNKYQ